MNLISYIFKFKLSLDQKKKKENLYKTPFSVPKQRNIHTIKSFKNIVKFYEHIIRPLMVWIQQTGTFLRDGNTGPPYLSPEKSVCRARSNS